MATAKPGRRSASARKRRPRCLPLTAVYVRSGRWHVAWVAEAVGVHTQARTRGQARERLVDVIRLMLEEAPENFGIPADEPIPPAADVETMFVVLPDGSVAIW